MLSILKNELKRFHKPTVKHSLLGLLGAVLITVLGVLRSPMELDQLSLLQWVLIILVPMIPVSFYYITIQMPDYSVFRSIRCLIWFAAPLLLAFLAPIYFDPNKKLFYVEEFYGSFLPLWILVWWLGIVGCYIVIRLCEYVGTNVHARGGAFSGVLSDLAVMYTPQKKISSEKRDGKGKWAVVSVCLLLIAIGVFAFVVALFLYNVYSNMEFEAILFTVTFAKGGLAIEDIIAGTEYTILFAIIAGYIGYHLVKCFSHKKIVVADTNEDGEYTLVMTGKKRALHVVLSVLLFLGCTAFFAIQTNLFHYLKMKGNKSTIYEEYYVTPDASVLTFPEKKRNLIFIYLESYENSYASKDVGGSQDKNYISDLYELTKEKDCVSFSNTDQLGGASVFVPAITYTQGSTVAQTSGIALNTQILPPSGEVEYPSMIRLEDILHDNGYNQIYIEGSKGEFSMYDEYVGRYDDCTLYDRINLVEEGYASEDSDYIWKWGIEDRKLFDITKQKITEASKDERPFFVTMYTMDTHSFECGHRCALCDETIGQDYLAAVNCTSRQTAEFVKWVQQQPFYENTTIILVGDHLGNEKTSLVKIDDSYVRTTYNCFINPAKEAVNTKNRQFSSLDMFPSTLSAIGVEIKGDRLGLGTDLFSGTKTLCEELGEEEYKKQLEQRSDYYDTVFAPE
ncbi:MAG: LTA synthase family protein [Eubacterium sp.]|nr:LTA synthase family protein [Eubacterium sp.]